MSRRNGRGINRPLTSTGQQRYMEIQRYFGPLILDFTGTCEKARDRTRSYRWRAGSRRTKRHGRCGLDIQAGRS